ncbi:hypothetical protein, partial [Streptomyces sp.]|uniref:hypothetical protein n=1 Tax=Streptomyces sp. TaxID=1931 RepID=UPI002F9203BA
PLRDPTVAGFEAEPRDAPPPYYVTVAWLDSLVTDLERITGTGGGGGGGPGPEEGAGRRGGTGAS